MEVVLPTIDQSYQTSTQIQMLFMLTMTFIFLYAYFGVYSALFRYSSLLLQLLLLVCTPNDGSQFHEAHVEQ